MIAIIPASGKGTRLALFSRFMPKELLPVKGKPAIDWAIEEALAADTEPIVVTAWHKTKLIDYLKCKWGLDIRVERTVVDMSTSINYARPKDTYAVILPDVVAIPPVLGSMLTEWAKSGFINTPVTAVAKFPHGLAVPWGGGNHLIVEKPLWVVGRYIVKGKFLNPPNGKIFITESKIITLEAYYDEQNNSGRF